MIHRNKHPAGRISNMQFGICSIADGLIRVCSLGFLHSTLTLDYSRKQSLRSLQQLKATHAATKKILQDAGAVYDN